MQQVLFASKCGETNKRVSSEAVESREQHFLSTAKKAVAEFELGLWLEPGPSHIAQAVSTGQETDLTSQLSAGHWTLPAPFQQNKHGLFGFDARQP